MFKFRGYEGGQSNNVFGRKKSRNIWSTVWTIAYESACYMLNFVHQKDIFKSSTLAPMDVNLFGNRIYKDVTKLR